MAEDYRAAGQSGTACATAKAIHDATHNALDGCRRRLLDLTGRNNMVSFRLEPRKRPAGFASLIDASPIALYAALAEGVGVPFQALPPIDQEPSDEGGRAFQARLAEARRSDAGYRAEIAALPADQATSREALAAERRLRDRVREAMGMTPWLPPNPNELDDWARRQGVDPAEELGSGEPGRESVFRAKLLPDQMDRVLSRLRDAARTTTEQTGVNTLHAAFGFLEWYESADSDRALFSPLLLLPVEIQRRMVRSAYQYSLVGTGSDPMANETLSERLYRDFHIRLPDLRDGEDPGGYLERVTNDICEGRPRWRVRNRVVVAHFSFARVTMYHDLAPERWQGMCELAHHPLLSRILGGSQDAEAGDPDRVTFAEDHEVEAPEVSARVPLLVLNADVSQHSAVFDAMSGRNLVIEGPPGTGKSQTIANIVAAALNAGKRVLFMAEKSAALQVVKDRLDRVGLGDFCLELHSGRAKAQEVLDGLHRRMMRRPGVPDEATLAAKAAELRAVRDDLNAYVLALNAPLGAVGLTINEVLWGDRRRRHGEGEEARHLDGITFPAVAACTPLRIREMRSALERFEEAGRRLSRTHGSVSLHPWFGVGRVPVHETDAIARIAADTADALTEMAEGGAAWAAIGVPPSVAFGQCEAAAATIVELVGEAVPAPDAWRAATVLHGAELLEGWIRASHAYADAMRALAAAGARVAGPPQAEICRALVLKLQELVAAAPGGTPEAADFGSLDGVLDGRAAALEDAAGLLGEACDAIGLPDRSGIEELRVAIRAVGLAADAPRIEGGLPIALLRPEVGPVVERALEAIAALRAERIWLDQFVSTEGLRDADEVRAHGGALARAGRLAFARPSVRAAERFVEVIRGERPPASRERMATVLERLALFLERRDELAVDRQVRQALGHLFRGVDTDTQAALSAMLWAGRVRSMLHGEEASSMRARDALLADDKALVRLAHFSRDPRWRAAPEAFRPFEEWQTGLGELVRQLRTLAEAARLIATNLERLGVPRGTPLRCLPGLAADLQAVAERGRAAEPPAELVEAAGRRPDPLRDVGEFGRAAALHVRLGASSLSEDTRRAITGLDPAELAALAGAATRTLAASARARRSWSSLCVATDLDVEAFLGGPLEAAEPLAAAARLRSAADHPGELGAWHDYLGEVAKACEAGVGQLAELWEQGCAGASLTAAFERVLYRDLARHAFAEYPQLARFSGLSHEEARRRYRRVDAEFAALGRKHMVERLLLRPVPRGNGAGPKGTYTERALIEHNLSLSKRRTPLRKLFVDAGNAIQALKPCFMMSPLSVAQFLQPGGIGFDLLVIDEASQMRPEDALGAIARCAQIVVVGDPKQLPPTTFFSGDDDTDDEEDEQQVDSESILDLALAVFRPARRLRWHYRSRHGKLIAFSNREFYDNDLVVFPSPTEEMAGQAVSLVKVNGIYRDRRNDVEAEAVCKAAAAFMREHPDRSLGVVTLNMTQKTHIQEMIDKLALQDPAVQDYRDRWHDSLERFFVKNLENIQGDERDAIFISTGFGPPGEHISRVAQNFGPISGKSGHRRLNVLFTRAKHQMRVFTSLSPEDVKAGPGSPRGAQVLKSYLRYAATGQLEAGRVTGRGEDSDFEIFVRDRLRLAGYEAVPQVGVSGYSIDLGIRNPDDIEVFLAGIECDGATYHSSKSARDRDILRQEILEGLGWRIHRVWSTDWFKNPEGETRKMVAFLEECRGHEAVRRAALASTPARADVPSEGTGAGDRIVGAAR